MLSQPEPIAAPVVRSATTSSEMLASVHEELHQLLSHQAAILVLASAASVQIDRDPSAAQGALARIGVAAEAAMRDLRQVLGRLEAAESPGRTSPLS
jgi:hypothetical protein